MEKRKKGYTLMLVLSILFTVAAISTVIPQISASKECLFGYQAHCTFTPISTIICLLIAGFICKIRKKKYSE